MAIEIQCLSIFELLKTIALGFVICINCTTLQQWKITS